MRLTQLKTLSHKTLAGVMAIWLSGVVFLLCCEQMNARSMEAEFCPMAKMPAHCDKAKAENTDSSFAESTSTVVDCCGFLPAVFDKVRKIERVQKQLAPAPMAAAVKFTFPVLKDNSPVVFAFPTRMTDRQSCFIKNCVFRI